MKNPIYSISAILLVSATCLQAVTTVLTDSFDDLTAGAITRTAGTLRNPASGPVYLAAGSAIGTPVFTAVDASAVGGNFSGTALEFNFSASSRFLYIPFTEPGWAAGNKIKVTFDFAYSADPTNQTTSLWIAMHCQKDNLAGTADFSTADAIFTDDSGHSLKLAESTNPLSGSQYGFTNARITSSSGNFYNGPTGLNAFIQGTAPVNVSYELERVADALDDPENPGEKVDGTLLSIYINGILIDTIPTPTALVVGGYYDALAIWGRGTGMIDNLTITHTASAPIIIPTGVAIQFAGGSDVELSFDSVAGQSYQMEKSSGDLASWLPVGDPVLSVSGGVLTLQDAGGKPGSGDRVFYRVSVTN